MTQTGREATQDEARSSTSMQDNIIKANMTTSHSSERAGHQRINLTFDCPNEEARDFITGYLNGTLETLKVGVLPTNWKLAIQKDRTTTDVAERVAAAA